MSQVRGRDTAPERAIRKLVHGMGFRFRLHGKLPGRPDLVLAGRRTAIFVHGCFWHRHARCRKATMPATRREAWLAKFAANKRRDRRNERLLRKMGWRVVVVWQCELTNLDALRKRLKREIGKKVRPASRAASKPAHGGSANKTRSPRPL